MADDRQFEFEGHSVRTRLRWKDCGRDCTGCPHPTVVVELRMPSGRARELWGEPPKSSGRRAGPPRTKVLRIGERSVRGPRR